MIDAESRRVARQLLETDLLLGLDQVVRGSVSHAPAELENGPDTSSDADADAASDAASDVVADEPAVRKPEPDQVIIESRPVASGHSSSPKPDSAALSSPTRGVSAEAIESAELALPFPIEELDGDESAQRLDALAKRHASECGHCTRATGYTNVVFGEGSPEAELMFVGEAPGATEDRLGRPFVGPAGEKLDDMIKAMGMAREDVYIANVLKTRPPNNRTPMRDESEACGLWLAAQVAVVQPSVIVALGGPAAKLLLRTEVGITRLRGAWGGVLVNGIEIPVMPTYHPAYVLRQYTPQVRGEVWNDLQLVMARLEDARG